jgi:hypothetical protein
MVRFRRKTCLAESIPPREKELSGPSRAVNPSAGECGAKDQVSRTRAYFRSGGGERERTRGVDEPEGAAWI